MFFIVSLVFFILSAIAIAYFVWKHWEDVQSVDVSIVEAKRRTEVKSTILEDRLKRKLFSRVVAAWRVVLPHIRTTFKYIKKTYGWIAAKERTYRSALESRKFKAKEDSEKEAVIEEKLEQVEDTEDSQEREHQLLEVIALDPKNAEAYEELAELYVENKQLQDAVDVYDFLIKLKPTDIDLFLDYSDILAELETHKPALEVLQQAQKQEPKNPKIIDRITSLAILVEDKFLANQSLKTLQQVNPDNKKIQDFQERIRDM